MTLGKPHQLSDGSRNRFVEGSLVEAKAARTAGIKVPKIGTISVVCNSVSLEK